MRRGNVTWRNLLCGAAGVCGAALMIAFPARRASAHVDGKTAGAEVFATSGCTHCHGAEGQGGDDGPALRNLRKHLSAQRIEHQIEFGGGAMPAFGSSLSRPQIDELVTFLRAKQWTPLPADASPAQP